VCVCVCESETDSIVLKSTQK